MTYFSFLLWFLVVPILILLVIAWIDSRRGKVIPAVWRGFPAWAAILIHIIVALAYTTLWDNYLVATAVWRYNPALVAGFTLGWVPVEEYTFFVLQPILAGVWMVFWMRRLVPPEGGTLLDLRWRTIPSALLLLLWVTSLVVLVTGWQPGTYLALELVWALPAILLQFAFGGDILRRYGQLVLVTLLPVWLFLSAADALAIRSGTWEINPAKSLPFLLGGILPVEELLFFLLTTALVTLGMVLVVSPDGLERLHAIQRRMNRRNPAGGEEP